MKKIWIKVIHPAPYTYIWKTATTNLFDIQYYYDFDKSLGKIWDDYNAEKVNKGNSLFSLSKKVRKSLDFDIVILSGWNRLDNLLIAFFRNFLLRKKVFFFADYPLGSKNKITEVFKFAMVRCISNGILSATKSGVLYFSSKPFMLQKNVYYFPYGVSLVNCYNDKDNFQKLNSSNLKRLFIASNMIHRKGHLFFIDSLMKMPDNLLNKIEVNFAGHGEYSKKVADRMKMIKVKSIFHGWLSLKDYETLLNKIDILVHPSFDEPFGIPPIEAMLLGKIVVVSSGVHSLDGLINNGFNGFVYNKNDVHDLKNKITLALSCDAAEIAKNARVTALKYFGKTQLKNSFIDISNSK